MSKSKNTPAATPAETKAVSNDTVVVDNTDVAKKGPRKPAKAKVEKLDSKTTRVSYT